MKKLYILIVVFILILISVFLVDKHFLNINSSKIDIVFISDNKYIMPLRTSIKSIAKNKKYNTKVEITIIGLNLSEENIQKLKKDNRKNLKINVLKADEEILKNFNKTAVLGPHVTRADLLKFYIPSILKDKNKVLYLDSDIIVLKDLTKLFNTDIDDYYIAASDDWDFFNPNWVTNSEKRYFNCGVMLLNLEKMRKDNIENKLIEYKLKDTKNEFFSQNTFNYVIDKVKFVHLKYNTHATNYDRGNIVEQAEQYLNVHFLPSQYLYKNDKDYRKNVVILHFVGPDKPWNEMNFDKESYRIWYRYAVLDFWVSKLKSKFKPYGNI